MKNRIIIVDGGDCALDNLIAHYEHKGYEVISTVDPTFCAAFLRSSQCECPSGVVCGDVLITDKHMPLISGLEFMKRQLYNNCKMPLESKAVISRGFTAGDIDNIDMLGCACFTKPFRLETLDDWVDSCIRSIDPSRRLRRLNCP